MKRLILVLAALIIFLVVWVQIFALFPGIASKLQIPSGIKFPKGEVKVITEESVTIDVVKNVGPSVITVVEEVPPSQSQTFNIGPFQIFGLPQQNQAPQAQSIGSGFVVTADGIIATNKHVVSDIQAKYQIVTSNNKTYTVQRIYRDALNDIALLKIDPNENSGQTLKPVILGDSSHLQVGQFVVAIGTALGEFNNTVTTGVISGLGRAITAGDQFQGYIENLNNVIQTDAAINPGNSGGPLLNSGGQVIGINVAVAQGAQNVAFSIPINTVKDALNTFKQNGKFPGKAYIGVEYQMLSQQVALLNQVPQGAYVVNVVTGSPADKAGLTSGDVIFKVDGNSVSANSGGLAAIVTSKKAGDKLNLSVWHDGAEKDMSVTLTDAPQ